MGEHIARTCDLVLRAARSIDDAAALPFEVCRQATVDGYFYRFVKVTDPTRWVYESEESADLRPGSTA